MQHYLTIKCNRFAKERVRNERFSLIFERNGTIDCLGFTPRELQRLYVRFKELDKGNPPDGFLSREDLLNVREVALNPLGERLVEVIIQDYGQLFESSPCPQSSSSSLLSGDSNKISFEQFARVLARFRRGKGRSDISTKENKLLFLFSVRRLQS